IDNGILVIGELELAYSVAKGTFIGITGTNGKTTTTTLVGEIFKQAGKETYVGGNIGNPVAEIALSASESSYFITEVSSFQLETIKKFRAKVATILNLTPDHMDRHKTMENYALTKAKIFKNQKANDYLIMNYDDMESYKLVDNAKSIIVPFSRKEKLDFGVFVDNEEIVIKTKTVTQRIIEVSDIQIPGNHNLENALAAVAVSYFAGIETEYIREALRNFKGVEHRMELCAEVKGVRFINDSKGTNVEATVKAIEAINGKLILIAGGYDKGSEYKDLVKAFGNKVKGVALLGVTADKIEKTCASYQFTDTQKCPDMESCVNYAVEIAKAGDTVLLSPACASWGMYNNYEERGNHFKEIVKGLWTR
ncbi:MAG: UDP-N-acetylmuramoyl-L-alanine--D-glutamate ligase, partial [Anaerovoracaceae bacterium]